MNADSMLRYLRSLWNYISGMVVGWLIVIGVIIFLLLIFHCYRSTLVMAMRLIRRTKPRVRYLSQRKLRRSTRRRNPVLTAHRST